MKRSRLASERQPHGPILELGAKRLAVELGGAFVEQAGDHVGQALLAHRVEGRTALEMQRERQERDRGLADQIGFDAALADHVLDPRIGVRHRSRTQHATRCQDDRQRRRHSSLKHDPSIG